MHSFEPAPDNFAHLRAGLAKLPNVRLNQLALSDETKESLLYISEDLNVDHRAYPTEGELRETISINTIRLDDYFKAGDFANFEKVLKEARVRQNERPLRPWLIRIAHNLASNYHRDRARRPEAALDAVEPPSYPHGTERIVEGREELRLVLDRLRHLPDDRRDALIMRFALGMSNREIARALGRTDGATKVLIHRAIRQLEEEMSEE